MAHGACQVAWSSEKCARNVQNDVEVAVCLGPPKLGRGARQTRAVGGAASRSRGREARGTGIAADAAIDLESALQHLGGADRRRAEEPASRAAG